jgi:aldose 1-epimerase
MSEIGISNEHLALTIETIGGAIWKLSARTGNGDVPVLRPPNPDAAREPRQSGCYPLAPFCNRIANNRFAYDGNTYSLRPNLSWDPLNVHGNGWEEDWKIVSREAGSIELAIQSRHDDFPFTYDASQRFTLDGRALKASMSIVNRGERAMPFGFGWHPYFPLHADTTLFAPAKAYWEEGEFYLPSKMGDRPDALDFDTPRAVPRTWTNNGFEGWNGVAEIASTTAGIKLRVSASENCKRYFLFVPDPAVNTGQGTGFFSFEPLSHTVNGHNLAGETGLVRLEPGEELSGVMTIEWSENA